MKPMELDNFEFFGDGRHQLVQILKARLIRLEKYISETGGSKQLRDEVILRTAQIEQLEEGLEGH